jgi:hypothetical protein
MGVTISFLLMNGALCSNVDIRIRYVGVKWIVFHVLQLLPIQIFAMKFMLL